MSGDAGRFEVGGYNGVARNIRGCYGVLMTIQNIYHPDGEPAERLIIERDFERDRVIVTVDNHGARELISMSTTDMRALLHSAGLL